MELKKFVFRSIIRRPAEEVYKWHMRSGIVGRLIPPWEHFTIEENESDSQIKMRVGFGPYRKNAVFEYRDISPGESFKVVQLTGPFKHWEHKISVRPQGEFACELVDRVKFTLPFGWLGVLFEKRLRKRLERFYRYIHELISQDVTLFSRYHFDKPLRIFITGSHGFVGSHVKQFLTAAGHQVQGLPRNYSCEILEESDAILHLAGENIAGRWTEKKKDAILRSRLEGTKNLVDCLKQLKKPPKVFLCASAMGFYGDRGAEVMTEENESGHGLFLSKVCRHWEEAANEAKSDKIRVINLRFGMVLSAAGGALKKMALPFKFGLGGRIGSGKQYMSWVTIDDVARSIYHAIMTPKLNGPINITTPESVTNETFSRILADKVNRWMGPPLPSFFVQLAFGQMGDELFLASTRAKPVKLIESDFPFAYPKLKQALDHVL